MSFRTTSRCVWSAFLLLCLSVAVIPASVATAQDPTAEPTTDGSSELASQLPPADLPTMNEQGYVFEITSTFTGSLESLPQSAPVYLMNAATYDATQAQQFADQLGIGQPVTDNGGGSFTATGNGRLFVSPGLVQFISSAAVEEGGLPGDTEAVAFAREWLRQTSLLPADIGEGRIEAKVASPPRVIVTFKPVQPAPLLSSIPGISVTLGPNGVILEASVRWATLAQGDTYQLTPPETAWADVEQRRSYVNVSLPAEQFPAGSTIKGTAEYTSASITYTSSGIPGEQQYLQPVIVFSGRVTPEGSTASYAITAYVPGLINSNQPVG
jgi:hypothetical protein